MRQPPAPRAINLIVIHCLDVPDGRHTTVADVDRWHRERGFAKIGYHHVIYLDGTVATGRPLAEAGAHALNFNSDSVGIALVGRSRYYPAQWRALADTVRSLAQRYAIPLAAPNFHAPCPRGVIGHRELPKVQKECPGFSVQAWLNAGMQPQMGNILEGAPQ